MLSENNADPKILLVNIYWAGELSAQYFLRLREGQTVSQAEELLSQQWSESVRALQLEDPDDDWTIDDVVERMRLQGWQLEQFGATVDVEV